MKKENLFVILTGVVIGIAALVLTALGNPANMGFCIACFERDIAGAVGLHSAAKVQYVRPEIIGLVLGSFLMAIATKEWKAKAGSSPALRFVLGPFVMIGALAFLGCPLRMVLRLAGGEFQTWLECATGCEVKPSLKLPPMRLPIRTVTKMAMKPHSRCMSLNIIVSRRPPTIHMRDFCASAPTTRAMTSAMKNGACLEPGPSSESLKRVGTAMNRISRPVITAGRTVPSSVLVV